MGLLLTGTSLVRGLIALGNAIDGVSLSVTGAMVVSVQAPSLIHFFFKDYLIDLC